MEISCPSSIKPLVQFDKSRRSLCNSVYHFTWVLSIYQEFYSFLKWNGINNAFSNQERLQWKILPVFSSFLKKIGMINSILIWLNLILINSIWFCLIIVFYVYYKFYFRQINFYLCAFCVGYILVWKQNDKIVHLLEGWIIYITL